MSRSDRTMLGVGCGEWAPPRGDSELGWSDALGPLLQLSYPQARDRVLDEFDERYVAAVLARHGGDVAKAAAASGIGRRYFNKIRFRVRSAR